MHRDQMILSATLHIVEQTGMPYDRAYIALESYVQDYERRWGFGGYITIKAVQDTINGWKQKQGAM